MERDAVTNRRPMDRAEIIAHLEDLAREGGDIARLGALKQLLTLPEHNEPRAAVDAAFAELDAWSEMHGGRSAVTYTTNEEDDDDGRN
jgi:hypothetical protein